MFVKKGDLREKILSHFILRTTSHTCPYFLPEEIINYFDIVVIEEKSGALHIRLFEFPILDRKVILYIRRRRWIEKHTGKSLSRS